MNSAQKQSDDLVLRAWRRGELDAASEDDFETRLFFEPDLLASAQADQAIAAGMKLVEAESPELLSAADLSADEESEGRAVAESTLAAATVGDSHANAGRRRRRPIVAGPWSMLLAAGLGAVAILPFASQFQSAPQATGNLEWVSIDVRRGAESEPLLVSPRASAGVVAMELAAPAGATAPLTLSLIAVDSGEPTMVIAGLEPSDGLLSFAFARDQLPAGDYRIEIVGGEGLLGNGESMVIRYVPGVR
jgi:hypothetical protein